MCKRIFIYPKDICNLTGYSLRKAQRFVQELCYLLKKKKHQKLTIKEYAEHMGIEPAEIVLN
jgi:hypothetical protein